MATPPAGTITFLLTDIEGSTKLWERHPEAMKAALAQHDAILVGSVESNGGLIIKTTGDGILAVFETAVKGVAAALAAQLALQAEAWEAIKPHAVRVRIGLHTGEAEYREGDYFGTALNRAARLMAVGYGGQILMSNTTAGLARDGLPANADLRDLGEHRLKDLARPEHIYQLVHPALPSEFPPLKTFGAIPNNLPVQLTSFIGREKEIADIRSFLDTVRLITLTGSGGTGKTRLAQKIGALELPNFPQGVWLIELASLSSPSQIFPAMAQVFGLQELLFEPLPVLITDYLREKKALLILDNCEHLIEACARLADDLLHHCTQLRILASSREALGIPGEMAYHIPSLSGPESTRLFIERASAVNPRFGWAENSAPSIEQICLRLDGIPLAIELAAARVKLLSPEQIAARLNDRFRLLIGGSRTALPRQQTLRALIDWSYDLLSEDEKELLRTVSVFLGGWTLEAIEIIEADPNVLEQLEQLLNKSLVVTEEREDGMRFSLLETIRQYAREKLFDSGQAVHARDRHFAYYDAFSETAWEKYRSDEMLAWVNRVEDEIENFRAALEWGLDQHPEETLHLAANVSAILSWRGNLTEARTWIQAALDRFEMLPPVTGEALLHRKRLRAKALWTRSNAEINQGDNLAAVQGLEEAIALSRQTGDQSTLGYSLQIYYLATTFIGGRDDGPAAAEEGLAVLSEIGDQWGIAQSYLNMARVAMERGNLADREKYAQKALQVAGSSPIMIAFGLLGLGMSERYLGHLETARGHFLKGLALFQQLRNKPLETVILSELGHIARQTGDFAQAIEAYKRTILRWQEHGSRAAIAHELECFGIIAVAQQQLSRAAKIFGAAEVLREKINSPMTVQERNEYESSIAQLHSLMDEVEYNASFAAGRTMTMEQAIQLALE